MASFNTNFHIAAAQYVMCIAGAPVALCLSDRLVGLPGAVGALSVDSCRAWRAVKTACLVYDCTLAQRRPAADSVGIGGGGVETPVDWRLLTERIAVARW